MYSIWYYTVTVWDHCVVRYNWERFVHLMCIETWRCIHSCIQLLIRVSLLCVIRLAVSPCSGNHSAVAASVSHFLCTARSTAFFIHIIRAARFVDKPLNPQTRQSPINFNHIPHGSTVIVIHMNAIALAHCVEQLKGQWVIWNCNQALNGTSVWTWERVSFVIWGRHKMDSFVKHPFCHFQLNRRSDRKEYHNCFVHQIV